MTTIQLQSNDGVLFNVDLQVAKKSKLISNMLRNSRLSQRHDSNSLLLKKVDSRILEMIIEWATHHKDDPPAMSFPDCDESEESDESDSKQTKSLDIGEWDTAFLNVDNELFYSIFLASHYLDIPELLQKCAKFVAAKIRGKTVEEIRQEFGIENDFTPKEHAELEKENEWCNAK